ncbi:hypothetical protein [Streptomyces sp. NPDC020681]|uniref:hypothetical protein n=1 Tax=Streptomyces sp. NPDC020681 TaxID=3365083 RepID=UPI0037AA437A
MAEDKQSSVEPHSFLTCATEVARLLGVEDVAMKPDDRHARHLAHAVRKPLLERASLPEELFAPLMAAAVYDPDPQLLPLVRRAGRLRVRTSPCDDSNGRLPTDRHGC